jgi:hypothetical protein
MSLTVRKTGASKTAPPSKEIETEILAEQEQQRSNFDRSRLQNAAAPKEKRSRAWNVFTK